nr:hypothetical protein [uncultured bacterium]
MTEARIAIAAVSGLAAVEVVRQPAPEPRKDTRCLTP